MIHSKYFLIAMLCMPSLAVCMMENGFPIDCEKEVRDFLYRRNKAVTIREQLEQAKEDHPEADDALQKLRLAVLNGTSWKEELKIEISYDAQTGTIRAHAKSARSDATFTRYPGGEYSAPSTESACLCPDGKPGLPNMATVLQKVVAEYEAHMKKE
jgi:hypothetical protein